MTLSSKSATAALPPPVTGGVEIGPILLAKIEELQNIDAAAKSKIIDGIRERSAAGFEKYACTLQTNNGRPAWVDLWQELLDAIQYSFKERLEGHTETPVEVLTALDLLRAVLAGDLDKP